MSWEEQAYSFGNPNAQPPTPTRTPTSDDFSSPTFQTPRANIHTFDDHSGWTPTFAEEYSVFNATPGRLTNTGGAFDISTPRPSTSSSQKGPPSTTDLEAEIASHVHHTVQTNFSLPLIDTSRQLPSSPRDTSHGTAANNKVSLVTPRKPRRRLEEAFSGQTATPPQSAAKSSRKLAPKPQKDTMQQNQEGLYPSSAPRLPNLLPYSDGPDDMFSYPMSAPASAPAFSQSKPFWDADTSMSGMEMDMSFSSNDGLFDPSISQRMNNSVDWGRSNQFYQDSSNLGSFDQNILHSSRSQRSKASMSIPSQDESAGAYSFGASISEDPFSIVASSGAVNPGLLYAFPDTTTSNMSRQETDPSAMSYSHSATNPLPRQPYQHQQRESLRDLEELRQARSSKEKTTRAGYDRAPFSSPAKKSGRPNIQRSASDSRAKISSARRLGQLPNITPRPTSADIKTISNRGRTSPMKHQSRMSLTSIPESVPGTRTSLTFNIDENGRARTITEIIVDEPQITKRRLSSAISEDWDSQHSDSSTDEEPIIVPSRSTSFSLPARHTEGPKLARFDTFRQPNDGSQRRIGTASSRTSSQPSDEQESEAETVVDEFEVPGDATSALRKVMEGRKPKTMKFRDSQHHTYSTDSNRRRSTLQSSHRNSQQYYDSGSSTNLSPTTVSDPDLATPSTDRESSRSDSTRCVCSNRDGDGFMIQCESCEKWLHAKCVGISRHRLPNVYICAFCAQTPNMRGGRIREPARGAPLGSSPLAHKSFKSWR